MPARLENPSAYTSPETCRKDLIRTQNLKHNMSASSPLAGEGTFPPAELLLVMDVFNFCCFSEILEQPRDNLHTQQD